MANNPCLASAIKYRGLNFSVIPVGRDKRPIVKWEEFQQRRAMLGEIKRWWDITPQANVGIVTGAVSGLAVVDCDSKDAIDRFKLLAGDKFAAPEVKTPRGGSHFYCQMTTGLSNNTGALPKVDLRAEGGYVVAPPSLGPDGKNYQWITEVGKCPLPQLPEDYLKILKEPPPQKSNQVDTNLEWFTEGRRDNDLFTLAWLCVRNKMPEKDIYAIVSHAAASCVPPFPKKEAEIKIKSAVDRAMKKERNIAQEVRNIVAVTDGHFSVTDCYNLLQVATSEGKSTVRMALHRLRQEGVIEKAGHKDGVYRRVEVEVLPVDWVNAPTQEYPIRWPFSLESFIGFYSANIAIVAGSPNAGKTAFLLDVVKRNMIDHDVHYSTSEMGSSEMRIRLALHEDVGIADWKFHAWERSSNFADIIKPDALNIIDYLEVSTEFYLVAATLTAIHEKLRKGVAVIALQKNFGQDLGRGASFGTEKPRLYLSLDHGTLKIIKAKNWKGTENPNFKQIDFKLIRGWKFIPESDWYVAQEKK